MGNDSRVYTIDTLPGRHPVGALFSRVIISSFDIDFGMDSRSGDRTACG